MVIIMNNPLEKEVVDKLLEQSLSVTFSTAQKQIALESKVELLSQKLETVDSDLKEIKKDTRLLSRFAVAILASSAGSLISFLLKYFILK